MIVSASKLEEAQTGMAIERSLKQIVLNESGGGSLYHSKQFNFPIAHAVTHEIILEVSIKTFTPALEVGDAMGNLCIRSTPTT